MEVLGYRIHIFKHLIHIFPIPSSRHMSSDNVLGTAANNQYLSLTLFLLIVTSPLREGGSYFYFKNNGVQKVK